MDDHEEDGLVLDQATLVLGDEDPVEEVILETTLVLGMRTPTKVKSGKPATPKVLQRGRGTAT